MVIRIPSTPPPSAQREKINDDRSPVALLEADRSSQTGVYTGANDPVVLVAATLFEYWAIFLSD